MFTFTLYREILLRLFRVSGKLLDWVRHLDKYGQDLLEMVRKESKDKNGSKMTLSRSMNLLKKDKNYNLNEELKNKRIKEIESQITSIEGQMKKRENRINLLKEDVVKKQQRIENYETDFKEYKTKIEEKNLDIESAYAKRAVQRDARIVEVREKIELLQKELQDLDNIDEWKSNLRKKYQARIDANNERVENYEQRRVRTENSLQKYDKKIANLLELNQKDEAEIKELQKKMEELDKPKSVEPKKTVGKAKSNQKVDSKSEKK
jgi:chromosome segregation ATPase